MQISKRNKPKLTTKGFGYFKNSDKVNIGPKGMKYRSILLVFFLWVLVSFKKEITMMSKQKKLRTLIIAFQGL